MPKKCPPIGHCFRMSTINFRLYFFVFLPIVSHFGLKTYLFGIAHVKVVYISIVFNPKCVTISKNTKNIAKNWPAPWTPKNSFLKFILLCARLCPIGWHLFGIAQVKVHVFSGLKIYVKLKLEEFVLNYVFCTMRKVWISLRITNFNE